VDNKNKHEKQIPPRTCFPTQFLSVAMAVTQVSCAEAAKRITPGGITAGETRNRSADGDLTLSGARQEQFFLWKSVC
jgi:hypothetical protein